MHFKESTITYFRHNGSILARYPHYLVLQVKTALYLPYMYTFHILLSGFFFHRNLLLRQH